MWQPSDRNTTHKRTTLLRYNLERATSVQKTPPVCLAGEPESTGHASPGQSLGPLHRALHHPGPPLDPHDICPTRPPTGSPPIRRRRGAPPRVQPSSVPDREPHAPEEAEMADGDGTAATRAIPFICQPPQTCVHPRRNVRGRSASTSEGQNQPIPSPVPINGNQVQKQTRRSSEPQENCILGTRSRSSESYLYEPSKTGKKVRCRSATKILSECSRLSS